jgi:hypothetical protein
LGPSHAAAAEKMTEEEGRRRGREEADVDVVAVVANVGRLRRAAQAVGEALEGIRSHVCESEKDAVELLSLATEVGGWKGSVDAAEGAAVVVADGEVER